MFTYLDTGETLKCRKCDTDAWCIDTVEGLRVGCSKCENVITGDRAEAKCFEQRLYVEASLYQNRVKKNGDCTKRYSDS